MSVDLPELKADSTDKERFNRRAAMTIAILAMLLAIAGLNGNNATEDSLNNNIFASDTWAFYQAKNIRQSSYKLARNELDLASTDATPERREKLAGLIAEYDQKITSYESEPETGEGKVELKGKAEGFEKARDIAMRKDQNFDMAETFLQIGIVVGSVSIIAYSRWLLWFGVAIALAGTVYMVNGYGLIF